MSNAKDFEKAFRHGKGLIPTPDDWIAYFWKTHRERVIESLNPLIQKSHSILFVGVGTGDVLYGLDTRSKTVVGIDLNMQYLSQAKPYCRAIAADSAMLPVKDETFDLVVCNMVLHHIVGQGGLEKTFAECRRVLKENGRLIAFEPNLFHPSGLALTLLNVFHLYHAVGGGSDYEYALSPLKLSKLLRRDFKEIKITSVTFGHPRFPMSVQRLIFSADRHLKGLWPLGFSFMISALKR